MADKQQDSGTSAPNTGGLTPGMMGDGTEEQNLNQPGNPEARITEEEVQTAFEQKASEPTQSQKP